MTENSGGGLEGCDITLALPPDAEALAKLAAETFPLACPPGTRPEDIASFIREVLSPTKFSDYLADSARVILLARRGSDPIGYAMLILTVPTDPDVREALTAMPTAELSKFYIRQHAHGRGVAQGLMHAATRSATESGAAGMWLGVNQENTRAQSFYRRNGFAVVGVKRFTVGVDTHEDFTMERVLSRPSPR